jgi:large repetitive protein
MMQSGAIAKPVKARTGQRKLRPAFVLLTSMLFCLISAAAHAAIENTVVATGTSNGNPVASNPSSQSVPVTPATAQISLNKTWSFAPGGDVNNNGLVDPGDTVLFSYAVTNSGTATLSDVSVTDTAFQGTGAQSAVLVPTSFTDGGAPGGSSDSVTGDGDWDELGPGDSVTFTRTYTVPAGDFTIAGNTDDDIDTTGQASGSAGVQTVTASDPEPVPLNAVDGSITLAKSGTPNLGVVAPAGIANPGDTISYSFTVQNTGSVALDNVTVTDPGLTVVGGNLGTLAPGATAVATATLTLTQAIIDTGIFNNTAGVTGDPANGAAQVSANDSESVVLPAPPAITLAKTGVLNDGGDGIANAGDTVSYTFAVQNTGGVTLNGVVITDPGLTLAGGSIGTLAPGANGSATATLTLTQAMIDAGIYNNTATVTGTPANGTPLAPVSDSESVVLPAPGLTLAKSGVVNVGANGRPDAGETISYTFTVTNSGNLPLTNIAVSDPLVAVSGGPISLNPGQSNSTTFTASYSLTQADIDAGTFANTASATGTPSVGPPVTVPGSATTPLGPLPALTLVKTGTPDFTVVAPATIANVGDQITYTIDVTNTGNVTLANVTVSDPVATVTGGAIGDLAPGATVQVAASYIITQADIDAGTFANTASVTANPPTGPPVTVDDTETVIIPNSAAVTLAKIGSLDLGGDGEPNPGDVITYSFRVENTGVTTLTNVVITDTLPGVSISGGPIVLTPGQIDNATFVGSYSITQADIDAGEVLNTATVTGRSGAQTATNTAQAPVAISPSSTLTLDKQVASTNFGGDGRADAGDTVAYTFLVTNTGRTTLRNVTISDPQVARLQDISTPALAALDALRSGADPMITASTAVVKTTSEIGIGQSVPPLYHNLSVTRRLVLLSGDPKQLLPGDRVGVLHEVVNSGDGPLTNIRLSQTSGEVFNERIDYLAPGESDDSSFVLVRELTLEDILLGVVRVDASLSARARNSELQFIAGQALALSEIEGYETLATAVITPASFATLAPGASTTFNGTYVLKQADVDAGTFTNEADARGQYGPSATPSTAISPLDSATVLLPDEPQIALVKTFADAFANDASPQPGETLTYTFTVTNPGNVSLASVAVSDVPLGLGAAITFQGGDANNDAVLQPSETWTYQASYLITQADIDAGEKRNQATVNAVAVAPSSQPVTDLSDDDDEAQDEETVVPLAQDPEIAIVKTAAAPTTNLGRDVSRVDEGDTVEYTFTVTNAGNVSLSAVSVSDPLAGLPVPVLQSGDANSDGLLQVGETWIFTSTYTLAQANLDVGRVENQATASGIPPTGPPVTDLSDNDNPLQNDGTVLILPQAGSLTVVKVPTAPTDANSNGITDLGDTVNYDITVTNTGTVTLAPVTVTDANALPASQTIATLAPGGFQVVAVSHLVTAADVTAREVENQARAVGRLPNGSSVTDLSDESDPAGNDPTVVPVRSISIALLKPQPQVIDTVADGVTGEGDTLRYTFTVVNTGTETLTNIAITDPLAGAGGITGSLPSLAAGASDTTSFTFDYVITTADMTAGEVLNQARVTATGGPSTTPVQDDSDESSIDENDPTQTFVGLPEIALVKTAGTPRDANNNGQVDVGDVIDYTFTVTNTGGVRLTNVRITDAKVGPISGSPIAQLLIDQSNSALTASYAITQTDLNRGFVENHARVIANYTRGTVSGTVNDLSDDTSPNEDDPTRTNLSQEPGIALVKTISSVTDTNGNGVNDPGDIINYAFAVTNTGNVTLRDIRVSDDNADMRGGPLARLLPGQTDSRTFTATHRVTGEDARVGKVTNSARAEGFAPSGSAVSDVSDNRNINGNNPTVIEVFTAPPTVTKTSNRINIRRGEIVTYTITANGLTGLDTAIRDVMPPSFNYIEKSASLNGRRVEPRQTGRTLTFTGFTPDIDGAVVIKLKLIAGATLTSGKFVNTAEVVNRSNGRVIATARATVEIQPEHVFDCGDIVGRVFDDANGSGYYDDGEAGLAGVNVITAGGLIVTTDEYGRYHVACAAIPNFEIGSNFIMKLDLATLPAGYAITTENPRDVRLTRGKVTKLNFGAKRSCDVRLDLRKDAFLTNSTALKPQWTDGLGRLSNVLQQCPGKLEIVYVCGKAHPIIEGRLASIETAVRDQWDADGAPYDLNIIARSECSK